MQKEEDQAGQAHQTTLFADTPSARDPRNHTGRIGKRRKIGKAGQTYQTTISADTTSESQELDDAGRLTNLPNNVKDMIFGMLLKSPYPIKLNTTSLMGFVYSRVYVPFATSSQIDGRRTKSLFRPPHELNLELEKMKADLHRISPDQWPSRSVVSGLTLSLLYVSKAVYHRAARLFYSNNVFEFPSSRDGWLHLESFLTTIGPSNASSIHHLSVAVPKWHPDTSRDRLAGAIFDGLSPLTRLLASTNASEDRLLSAISTCTSILAGRRNIKSFQIDMQMNDVRHFLNHCVTASMYNLSKFEKKAHTKRKDNGVQLLHTLSRRTLSQGCRPELVIHAGGSGNKRKLVVAGLLPSIAATAKKYGWNLNRTLKASDETEVGDKIEARDAFEAEADE